MTVEETISKMIVDGARDRARFERLASRTASAIVRNTPNEFTEIVQSATSEFSDGHPAEVEPSVETGNTDGTDRAPND